MNRPPLAIRTLLAGPLLFLPLSAGPPAPHPGREDPAALERALTDAWATGEAVEVEGLP